MRYQVERDEFHNTVTIHTDKRIVGGALPRFKSSSDEEDESWKGDERPQMVKDIMGIDGVVGVYFGPYHITLLKAKLFDWTEIVNAAIFWLNEHLDPGSKANAVSKRRTSSYQAPSPQIMVGNFGSNDDCFRELGNKDQFGEGVW